MKKEIPGIVKLTSYLWFTCCAIMLLSAVMAIDHVLNVENTTALLVTILFAVILIPAYVFFRMGISTLRGTANHILLYGILSILFSMFGIFNYIKTPHTLSLIAIIILFSAGVLAIYGKNDYYEYASEINNN